MGVCLNMASAQTDTSDQWQVKLIPYAWFISIDGSVSAQGTNASVDNFFDSSKPTPSFAFEMRKGLHGFYGDFIFTDDSHDGESGGSAASLDVESSIMEVGYTYRAYEGYSAYERPAYTAIYAAGRFIDIKSKIDDSTATDKTSSKNWFDPILGVTHSVGIMKGWTLTGSLELGGLGIGSDFTWGGKILGIYDFTPNFKGWVGYRYLNMDYDHGVGSNRFEFDAAFHGPALGASFEF